jgi:hypothetical protein
MKMHERLADAIARSPKTQTEIAREAGFTKPNILSMLKRAQTRIPLTRIYPLARALDADGDLWMAAALAEYEPALYEVLRPNLTLPDISDFDASHAPDTSTRSAAVTRERAAAG